MREHKENNQVVANRTSRDRSTSKHIGIPVKKKSTKRTKSSLSFGFTFRCSSARDFKEALSDFDPIAHLHGELRILRCFENQDQSRAHVELSKVRALVLGYGTVKFQVEPGVSDELADVRFQRLRVKKKKNVVSSLPMFPKQYK
jgi:hypothetical protein